MMLQNQELIYIYIYMVKSRKGRGRGREEKKRGRLSEKWVRGEESEASFLYSSNGGDV